MPERKNEGRWGLTQEHPVRGMVLRRRRTRVPWIYLVYHVRRGGPLRRNRRAELEAGNTARETS
jgi:hypothetical protein